jgi:hypothetical protein
MTTAFLSYARSDDEPFVKRLYEDLTARGFDVWWDRVSMPGRGLGFLQEIRDAITARHRLITGWEGRLPARSRRTKRHERGSTGDGL